MKKQKEELNETVYIYLDNGQEIKVEYPESIFEEFYDELQKAMISGTIFQLDGSYDVSMYDCAGNYMSGLNGRKIVGYHF